MPKSWLPKKHLTRFMSETQAKKADVLLRAQLSPLYTEKNVLRQTADLAGPYGTLQRPQCVEPT